MSSMYSIACRSSGGGDTKMPDSAFESTSGNPVYAASSNYSPSSSIVDPSSARTGREVAYFWRWMEPNQPWKLRMRNKLSCLVAMTPEDIQNGKKVTDTWQYFPILPHNTYGKGRQKRLAIISDIFLTVPMRIKSIQPTCAHTTGIELLLKAFIPSHPNQVIGSR